MHPSYTTLNSEFYAADADLLAPARRSSSARRQALNAAAARDELSLSLVTDASAFEALEAEWKDLFERSEQGRSVFQSFNWLWHWRRHYFSGTEAGGTLAIVTGRKRGRLAVILPMMVRLSRGLKRLMFMGQPVSQYGDILHDPAVVDQSELAESFRFLIAETKADVLHLRKVREDAGITPLIRSLALTPVESNQAPFLDLSSAQTFEEYQQRYSSKARKNRRRLRRRLEEQGTVTVTTGHKRAERGLLAKLAVDLKRVWLNERGLFSPAVQDDRIRDFFVDASTSLSHPTGCRMASIDVDGETAALEISFRAKDHLAVHLIVYRLAYEKCGTGALLMEDSIKSALEAGVKTFDLMAPGDEYKLDWADGSATVHDWLVGVSFKGRLHQRLHLSDIASKAKSGVQKLPARLRKPLSRIFSAPFFL